jgi:hypothetical protein
MSGRQGVSRAGRNFRRTMFVVPQAGSMTPKKPKAVRSSNFRESVDQKAVNASAYTKLRRFRQSCLARVACVITVPQARG